MSYINVLDNGQFKPMASEEYVQQAIGGVGAPLYHGYVNKPLNISEKKVYFFGDSITEGHNGTTISQNPYVKVFSNHVGCKYVNKGEGGSCFGHIRDNIPTIVTKIKNTNLASADMIFINGGINDWFTNTTYQEFSDAMEEMGTYLTQNFNKPVTIITPINTTWGGNHTLTLTQIRTLMSKCALKYGFNLVLGENFNFPTQTGDIASILYGDGLHPSDAGHVLFAKCLANAVIGDTLPNCPTSTDGTYTLQCTVSSGKPTYSWVSQS